MKRYDGKNAWYFLLIIALYELLPIVSLFLFKDFSNAILLVGSYIFYYSFNLLLIPICVRNYIELYDDHFVFYYGFSKKEVQLTQIKTIEKTHDMTASSANSLNRIYIETYDDEFRVALKNNDEFIEDVMQRKQHRKINIYK